MKKIVTILFLLLVILPFSKAQSTYVVETKVNDLKIAQNNGTDIITLANSTFSDSIGNPMLPKKQLKVAIPSNNEVISISIVDMQEQEIAGEYNIAPVQEPSIFGISITTTKKNELIYNSNSIYPIKPLIGVDHCLMSGVKIYSLSYYPIRYNPVTKKIKLITSISFKLNYTFRQQESVSSSNLSQKSYDYITKHIKSLVINPSEVGTNSTLMKQKSQLIQNSLIIKPANNTIDYVIITNESLKDGFQEIADWKIKTGLNTKIVTTEWISQNFSGSDLQEKIRTFIKYAFQNWGAIWYLLGGGNQVVPVRLAWVSPYCSQISQFNSQGVFIPTDMYYACLDGNWNADGDMTFGEGSANRTNNGAFVNYGYNIDDVDMGADVYVGRIPVENNTELTHFKAKYFEYLKGTNVNATKALVFAQNSVGLDCREMNPVAENFPNTTIVDKLYECAGDNQLNCGTKQDVLNAFNSSNGYQIICGFGHGGPTSFNACTEGISNTEIDALQNSKRGQILYNNHCETLALDVDCIGEHYMNATNGGIAYIGYTRYGWSFDPPVYNSPFIWNIYNKSERLGEAFFDAKGTGGPTDYYPRWTFFSLNLLGDPEMPIWTNTPKTLSVPGIPSSVVCGNSTITVTVNNLLSNEQALISLRKGEELNTTSIVNATGNSYTFNINTKTVGQIELTVTSQNYIPFEATIPVIVSPNENLYVSSVAIDDDMSGSSHGNGNQQIDAGETIELTVGLSNNGLTTANNVVANINSTSSHVSLISIQSNFGTITSNNSAVSLSKFVFLVDKDTPELLKGDIGAVRFNLQISDGNGNDFVDAFNVDIHASNFKLGNRTIVSTGNGNMTIDPNEVVTFNIDLKNIGKAEARGLTAILTGNSSDITPRSYPNIASFETKNNIAVFQFTTGSTLPDPLNFHLQVKNEYEKVWDLPDFNLLDKPNQVGNLANTADVSEINLNDYPHLTHMINNFSYLYSNKSTVI